MKSALPHAFLHSAIWCLFVWLLIAHTAHAITVLPLPPLSEEQLIRLRTARDGQDHQEEAFAALAENLRLWPDFALDILHADTPRNPLMWADAARPPAASHAAATAPDSSDAIDARRGSLAVITGTLDQCTSLAPPYDTVLECFIRTPYRTPALVYILKSPSDPAPLPPLHAVISVPARFYKTVNFVARDNKARIYPAFVGIHYRLGPPDSAPASSPAPWTFLAWFLPLLVALFILMVILRARAARARIVTRTPPRN